MKYCYGCFQQLNIEDNACPYCGFVSEKYKVYKWTLLPGTYLNNKYILGRRLGEGGFGITYLAWDTILKTKVAIKEYYPASFVSRDVTSPGGNSIESTQGNQEYDFEKGLKKYVMEASILSKFFDLPGIVTVKDFFYENGTAYIVMEYIDGMSLKEYLEKREGKLSPEESINLIRPVISSLSVVHNNRLLHRDISPDNIMVERNGTVKLIDFGTARYFDKEDGEKSMTVMLKHGYAPIEQYSRNGNQSAHTDIYAICAVLYRMITGVSPTEAPDRVHEDKLIPIRKIAPKTPKHIAAAIEKGLSVMPENRQQSMAELENDLYKTKSELKSNAVNSFYRVVLNILVTILVIMILIIAGIIVIRINQDKINDFREKVHVLFGSEQEEDYSDKSYEDDEDDEPEDKKIEKKESNKKKENNYKEQDSKQKAEQNDVMIEDAQDDEDKKRISYGIMVVRDGVIDGNESITTGEILDKFSETDGVWSGYIDQKSNQLLVYYQGNKNNNEFEIEFLVNSDDTFKITGAKENGRRISNYSSYFKKILTSTGYWVE